MIDADELKLNLAILGKNKAVPYPDRKHREFELIRDGSDAYGIGLPVREDIELNEKFSKCRIRTLNAVDREKDEQEKLVVLTCSRPDLMSTFCSLALDFLSPENKELIYNDPYSWWRRWTALTGNSFRKKEPYSLIAELYLLKKLNEAGIQTAWGGSEGTIQDFETQFGKIEVKSTLKHHSKTVTIHGLFQLDSAPLELAFLRMEKSDSGCSLNDLVNQLADLGEDRWRLIDHLENMGYEENSAVMNEKYRVIEEKYYPVDKNFPKIVPESFVGGELPSGVTKIVYDISLDALHGSDSSLVIKESLKKTQIGFKKI